MASSSQASSASRSTRSGRPPSVAGPAAPAPAPAFAAAVAATATAHSPSPGPTWEHFDPTDDVPVEVLVEHLLAAKRSLSSITLVLRANEIETSARRLHEEAVILSAQTAFLRRGVAEQVRVLRALRRGMGRAYDAGRREFKQLIKTLDAANARLEQTMDMLRHTIVDPVFRPPGEDPKCLLDFVDETTVDRMRDALKESIGELQAAQTSFDGDLLRFDTDIRTLNKTTSACESSQSPFHWSTGGGHGSAYQPIPHLLADLTDHSHAMAEHLTSLNRHFDMCVQAVRATEGGAALARRKAAEGDDAASENGVSISGVIGSVSASASASAHTDAPHRHLDVLPSAAARAEIAQVVVQDAPEVAEVVAELEAVLARMEADFGTLRAQAGRIRAAFAATLAAFHALEDVGARLAGYAAAEAEFAARWAAEKDLVGDRLGEMDELRRFYEGYAGAYDSLRLEAERRRAVEAKIAATWRKARDAVDRLVERDRRERDAFRHEVGEYLPTDLWSGMQAPPRRWAVVPVEPPGEGPGSGASSHAGNTAGLKAARPGAEEERAAPKRRVARASGSMSGSFAGR